MSGSGRPSMWSPRRPGCRGWPRGVLGASREALAATLPGQLDLDDRLAVWPASVGQGNARRRRRQGDGRAFRRDRRAPAAAVCPGRHMPPGQHVRPSFHGLHPAVPGRRLDYSIAPVGDAPHRPQPSWSTPCAPGHSPHLRGGMVGRPDPATASRPDRAQRLGQERSCRNGWPRLAYRQRNCGDVDFGFRSLARALGQP